jgi:hypothetical protein
VALFQFHQDLSSETAPPGEKYLKAVAAEARRQRRIPSGVRADAPVQPGLTTTLRDQVASGGVRAPEDFRDDRVAKTSTQSDGSSVVLQHSDSKWRWAPAAADAERSGYIKDQTGTQSRKEMGLVKRTLKAMDVADSAGQVAHSKLMATLSTFATFLLIGFGRVQTEAEAFVLIAIIGVTYGHDWGKTLVKAKFGGSNAS